MLHQKIVEQANSMATGRSEEIVMIVENELLILYILQSNQENDSAFWILISVPSRGHYGHP